MLLVNRYRTSVEKKEKDSIEITMKPWDVFGTIKKEETKSVKRANNPSKWLKMGMHPLFPYVPDWHN